MGGQFSRRYIRTYPIKQQVKEVAYWLKLPPELPRVHNVFHVSQLRKYVQDLADIIEPNPVQLREHLSYEEQLIQILDRRETTL